MGVPELKLDMRIHLASSKYTLVSLAWMSKTQSLQRTTISTSSAMENINQKLLSDSTLLKSELPSPGLERTSISAYSSTQGSNSDKDPEVSATGSHSKLDTGLRNRVKAQFIRADKTVNWCFQI